MTVQGDRNEMSGKRIRIRGEGSITTVERGHKYRIRLRIPPELNGGKPKWSKQRTVIGNIADARAEIERYRAELEEELNNERCGLTVGEYAREFQQRRLEMGTLSPDTLARDELETRRIERLFGDVAIEDVDARTISAGYARLRREGVSANAVFKVHAKLSQILKRAVREDVIPSNPCDRIEDVKRPEARERRSLSAEQALQLARDLKEAPRDGRIVAVWIALATGCRRGEILGLTWADVDLESGRLSITHQLDKKKRVRSPKSRASRRNLAIDGGTVAFLSEWKAMQSERFFGGAPVPDVTPVCTNELGEFMDPNVFGRWRRAFFADHGLGRFKVVEETWDKNGIKRYKRSGYDGFNLHELRHTQATLLIGGGADIKTVQTRLGHSSPSLTLSLYAHAIEQKDRDAADLIGGIMGEGE